MHQDLELQWESNAVLEPGSAFAPSGSAAATKHSREVLGFVCMGTELGFAGSDSEKEMSWSWTRKPFRNPSCHCPSLSVGILPLHSVVIATYDSNEQATVFYIESRWLLLAIL